MHVLGKRRQVLEKREHHGVLQTEELSDGRGQRGTERARRPRMFPDREPRTARPPESEPGKPTDRAQRRRRRCPTQRAGHGLWALHDWSRAGHLQPLAAFLPQLLGVTCPLTRANSPEGLLLEPSDSLQVPFLPSRLVLNPTTSHRRGSTQCTSELQQVEATACCTAVTLLREVTDPPVCSIHRRGLWKNCGPLQLLRCCLRCNPQTSGQQLEQDFGKDQSVPL